MTATLSQLLSSQEARDAAPCVAAKVGGWILLRGDTEGLAWSTRLMIATQDIIAARNEDGRYGNPKVERKEIRALDIIWSGDLVAELAAVDALRAELAEAYAGNKQLGEQWNRLQDLIQSLEARNDALRAENAELRRVSEIMSRYLCNNLGSSLLAMCQAEMSGTYKPLEALKGPDA